MKRSAFFIKFLQIVVLISEVKCAFSQYYNCPSLKNSIAKNRPHSVTVTEFGAVGDGVTLNTKAFENALFYLNSFADKGGAQLFVPAGRWLTGSIVLTSHLTLSLDNDAVIIGSNDPSHWPLIDPLPSYGRGRELPGQRHQSLIYGYNLTDVVITGNNGTIDGRGSFWWDSFKNKTLNHTRPHLIEFMYSTEIVISDLTFKNSPFWAIHPVYSSQVHVRNLTILAPPHAPNTDGIDPDSSDNICIEDCYINTGDDVIVVKSGWDEYGISFARPSHNITIRRITAQTKTSAAIAFGSEMSGGISDIHVHRVKIFDSKHGIRIKTSPGRGGYIRNIHVSGITMKNVDMAIRIQSNYGEHPDDKYDSNALPIVERITIKNVVGENIRIAGLLEGIEGDDFRDICFSNIVLNVSNKRPWRCSDVVGYSNMVSPRLCESMQVSPIDSGLCYEESKAIRLVASYDKLDV